MSGKRNKQLRKKVYGDTHSSKLKLYGTVPQTRGNTQIVADNKRAEYKHLKKKGIL